MSGTASSERLSNVQVKVTVWTAHVECVVGDAVAPAASSCSSAPDADSYASLVYMR